MIDATVLGGVVGEGAAGSSEFVVESDAGGECEESCCDPGSEVAWCAGAVLFEAQEVFEGQEDGFDPLPDRGEMDAWLGLVFAGGTDDEACATHNVTISASLSFRRPLPGRAGSRSSAVQ